MDDENIRELTLEVEGIKLHVVGVER